MKIVQNLFIYNLYVSRTNIVHWKHINTLIYNKMQILCDIHS
jgi:hypothetical protein